ncbi:MAG: pyridoxal phosphate-dependent aminotransferase [Firmicutes bacterium]|nr:pyridoxal phosphate-dependent aminotransferase [Bacillota bacterium]
MLNSKALHYGTVRNKIRELFEIGRQKKEIFGPENVYDFTLGNPSVAPPKEVSEAFLEVLQTMPSLEVHGYTTAYGNPSARAAIAGVFTERFGGDFTADDFYLTCGATAALRSFLSAFISEPGLEVMVIAPYFAEYSCFIDSCGGKMVVVPPDKKALQIDLDAFEERISGKTCAVIVNTPNNPSGVIYTEETLRGMAAILEKKSAEYGHPIYVISDEPYREIVYDGKKVPFIPHIYRNTVICYSYSKCLSLPGERIGYMFVPKWADDAKNVLAAAAGAARMAGYVCAPSILQQVIERCAGVLPDIRPYEENRKLLYESLKGMGYDCIYPDGAFYLFVKAPGGDDEAFCEKALDLNILVVPGVGFGAPGYMRISYCVDYAMIRRALPGFEKLIKGYK